MTSLENNKDTIAFFEKVNYFGYPKEYIKFFTQSELPILDTNGKIMLDAKSKIKQAADGNGGIFESMRKSDIIKDMQKRGIEWLFIGAVDNSLLKMVDPILIGLSKHSNVLASAKSVVKANPHEKVGVFCKRNKVPSVIEYTELPDDMKELRDENGELVYGESHIMCNLFHIKALEQISKRKLQYHLAFKKLNYMGEERKNCYSKRTK